MSFEIPLKKSILTGELHQQMGDIYLEAERVLVWLGEASPQDARCLGAFVEFPYKASSVAEVGQDLAQMRMICDLPYWRRLW